MIRPLFRTIVALLPTAVGLIVAAALLDGVTPRRNGFVIAVVVFTLVFALIQPFLFAQLRRGANTGAPAGGVALIATLVALIVTTLVSDGLSISGIGDWIAATVIVWLSSVIATFLLPYLGLRKYLEARRT